MIDSEDQLLNRSEIIRMAREANIKQAIETPHLLMVPELERFAALVAAAEQKKWEEQTPIEINEAVLGERQRIVNLLMIQHEAAKGAHNYWHVAAQLIQADVASDT